VEAVTDAGEPVPHLRLDLTLADGEFVARSTDVHGQLRLEPIPQGRCTICVPELDGSAWHPEAGPASSPVDRGYKRAHVVRSGENLTRIAKQHGIKGWKKLWDAPDNERLRSKRKSPHVLRAGDEVVIPAIAVHEIVRSTDQTHRIVVSEAKHKVRLRLQDLAGEGLAGLCYEYGYELGQRHVQQPGSAATDGAGWLEETIPITVDTLTITTHAPKLTFVLALNALDPAQNKDTREPICSGLQTRLCALGYAIGSLSDEPSPVARAALAAFQSCELQRKQPSGELDDDTVQTIERSYGV
jgi:hypothetical protein